MTTISGGIGLGTLPLHYPRLARNKPRSFAYERLNKVFEAARVVPFDDSSRFVFFSDLHRGDNSRADAFVRNKALFLGALAHYDRQGFTYIEVGDGDELWKNWDFADIRRAHPCVFELLHRLNQQNRLHIILGNHDIRGSRHQRVEKDGIPTHEGLILRHAKSGQQVFVVHGHQADFTSDRLYVMSRFLVRYVWRPLQHVGLVATASRTNGTGRPWTGPQPVQTGGPGGGLGKIEQRIIEWVQDHWQITICGHTHNPAGSRHGAPPYFNSGSCVYRGYITGLELEAGELRLVKWSGPADIHRAGLQGRRREVITPPMPLRRLG